MTRRFLTTGCVLLAGAALCAQPASATTVTVTPAGAGSTAGCFPFGLGGSDPNLNGTSHWTPFAGFVYKNVPPFQLGTGDTIAFDTTAVNDTDIGVDIALAPTTGDGSDEPAAAFTQVVSNTESAANPRGDTKAGDFDLRFVAQAPFSFPGGGLVIRFSSPSPAYAADTTCTGDLAGAFASDGSEFFVKRFFADDDGAFPWSSSGSANVDIAAFQIVYAPRPPAAGAAASVVPSSVPASIDRTKPALSALGLSTAVFQAANFGPSAITAKASQAPVGAKVRFSLSEPGSVRFTVQRKTQGRTAGKKCVAARHSNRHRRACARFIAVRGSFAVAAHAGHNTFAFSGRLGGKALRPGRYRLTGQATDPSKNASPVKSIAFRIVR